MCANKESKMKYFLGGSAVGITVSFLIGKIIKNKSDVQAQTSKTEAINNEKITKYSQDDNIHYLSRFNNAHSGRVRAKSSSQYENVVGKDEPKVFNTTLTEMDNPLAHNMNDLSLKRKPNKLWQKEFDINVTGFHNTSIEDNTDIENLSDAINIECTANTNKKKLLKCSNHNTSAELSDLLNCSCNGDLQSLIIDENVSENNTDNNEKEKKYLHNFF